jgi:hypothetical protein
MAKKRKPDSLLAIALAPYSGALVTTRSKMQIKVIGGSGAEGTYPQYWEWTRGLPLLFCGVESETQCRGGQCRGWLKVITPMGFGWISPSAATQLDLLSEADSQPNSLTPVP